MVTKAEAERAMAQGAEWYCIWCCGWFEDDEVMHDHDHGFDDPLCPDCPDSPDVVPADRSYVVD